MRFICHWFFLCIFTSLWICLSRCGVLRISVPALRYILLSLSSRLAASASDFSSHFRSLVRCDLTSIFLSALSNPPRIDLFLPVSLNPNSPLSGPEEAPWQKYLPYVFVGELEPLDASIVLHLGKRKLGLSCFVMVTLRFTSRPGMMVSKSDVGFLSIPRSPVMEDCLRA